MTTDAATILDAYPAGLAGIDEDALVRCLQECLNCASAATSGCRVVSPRLVREL
jgi:hypothetical protein